MISQPVSLRPFRHHGDTGDMIALSLSNMLLSFATLSLWRFWGRTKVRRQLWGDVEAWGDPVEYTGTGKELFIGFLVVLVSVYLPLVAGYSWANLLIARRDPWGGLLAGVLYLLTVFLIYAGTYRARRYQLSRTVWRGIRGGQDGSALRFGLIATGIALLGLLSLGWTAPWGEMLLARYKMRHTRFGDRAFDCDAVARGLYRRFAAIWVAGVLCGVAIAALIGGVATLLGTIPGLPKGPGGVSMAPAFAAILVLFGFLPLGLIIMALPMAWYRAGFYRQLAAGTSFSGHRFSAEVRTWGLIRLFVGNLLISLFSLGVLRPWAALRVFRFGCAMITIDGEPDFAAVAQTADTGPRSGEGLISVLDGAGEF